MTAGPFCGSETCPNDGRITWVEAPGCSLGSQDPVFVSGFHMALLSLAGGNTRPSQSPTPVKHKSAIAHIWLSRFTIANTGAFTAFQKQSLFEEPFGLQVVALLRCSKFFAVAR
jgi:hypothetical protein